MQSTKFELLCFAAMHFGRYKATVSVRARMSAIEPTGTPKRVRAEIKAG